MPVGVTSIGGSLYTFSPEGGCPLWTLGMEVANRRHPAPWLDEEGKTGCRNFSFAPTGEGFDRRRQRWALTGGSPQALRVGREATRPYGRVLFPKLRPAGYAGAGLNPVVIAARRPSTLRGTQTEAVDALLLAGVLREDRPNVSAVPEEEVPQRRDRTRRRFESAQTAIAEKPRLRALLERVFPEYAAPFSALLGTTRRQLLAPFPTAQEVAPVDIRRLPRLRKEARPGRRGRPQAEKFKQAAKDSWALTGALDPLALEIRFLVQRRTRRIEPMAQVDQRLQTLRTEPQRRLQSRPGGGPVWAPTLLAEILPVFPPALPQGAKNRVAAAGIDVRRSESGESRRQGKRSKRARRYGCTAVLQAAEGAVFIAQDPLFSALYQRQRERGKHPTVALSHGAHKMLPVIFSVLKQQRTYTPMMA